MIALIDADLLVYRIGYTTVDAPEGIAIHRMDESIGAILNVLGTTEYRCFLTASGRSNFRYDIAPDYKAGRKVEKPTHYHLLRNYLVNMHGAEVIEGMEADDALGIAQTDDTVIVSIDKDMLQIPGMHFNFVKGTLHHVTPVEGLRSFYRSVLTGDRIDNISGIRGVGPVGAAKLIDHLETEQEMYQACVGAYSKHKVPVEHLERNASLLKICTKEGERWQAPKPLNS